tara:strand:+ start:577 stop:1059 length:483 start_codon:yes stop_codon:yes gene_type:complete
MNTNLWIRRGAALAIVLMGGLTLASIIAVGFDVSAVQAARSAVPDGVRPSDETSEWQPGLPALRIDAAQPEIAIGEYLNVHLGGLGLILGSVEVASLRPLAGGTRLAEIRVQARGDSAVATALANWVAVNREVVRLKSFSIALGPDGDGTCTFLLLMVVA